MMLDHAYFSHDFNMKRQCQFLLQSLTDVLLKGVQFPYYCAKGMMEGQPLC